MHGKVEIAQVIITIYFENFHFSHANLGEMFAHINPSTGLWSLPIPALDQAGPCPVSHIYPRSCCFCLYTPHPTTSIFLQAVSLL